MQILDMVVDGTLSCWCFIKFLNKNEIKSDSILRVCGKKVQNLDPGKC